MPPESSRDPLSPMPTLVDGLRIPVREPSIALSMTPSLTWGAVLRPAKRAFRRVREMTGSATVRERHSLGNRRRPKSAKHSELNAT